MGKERKIIVSCMVLFHYFKLYKKNVERKSEIGVVLNKPVAQAGDATPPIGKILPFSKIAVTFEPVVKFDALRD